MPPIRLKPLHLLSKNSHWRLPIDSQSQFKHKLTLSFTARICRQGHAATPTNWSIFLSEHLSFCEVLGCPPPDLSFEINACNFERFKSSYINYQVFVDPVLVL